MYIGASRASGGKNWAATASRYVGPWCPWITADYFRDPAGFSSQAILK